MSTAERYLEAKSRMKAAKDEANAVVKDAFAELAKEVFAAHPQLEAFSWKQYTPYFNDGDPCTFRCNTDYPTIRMAGEKSNSEDEDDCDDDEEGEFGDWDCYTGTGKNRRLKKNLTPLQLAGCSVIEFLKKFDEEDYLEMFDDHQRVTVTRDGEIEVEEYSHD